MASHIPSAAQHHQAPFRGNWPLLYVNARCHVHVDIYTSRHLGIVVLRQNFEATEGEARCRRGWQEPEQKLHRRTNGPPALKSPVC